jgi:hypothetical protein
VAGLTMVATSTNACFPSFFPISAKVLRSASLSHIRLLICWRKRRFSVTRYSFRSRSSWSTDPVMYASSRFQSMVAPPQLSRSLCRGSMGHRMRNARRGARTGGCVTAYKKVSSNNLTKRAHGHSQGLRARGTGAKLPFTLPILSGCRLAPMLRGDPGVDKITNLCQQCFTAIASFLKHLLYMTVEA